MKKQVILYFPDNASGMHGAGTGGSTGLTDTERVSPSTEAVDDGNETGTGDEWKEGPDWDNFGDEEVSENISKTGES